MFSARISSVWDNIVKSEGETFRTKRGIGYSYQVKDGYILINGDKRRRITKEHFEKALTIVNPTPAKIQDEKIWGPSYVYGIITDKRIK